MGFNKLLINSIKLLMVNSVLTTLLTFYMCIDLQKKKNFLHAHMDLACTCSTTLDKSKMHSLWDTGVVNKQRGCVVAWKVASRLKNKGQLKIIDIKVQNTPLLLKFLVHYFSDKKNDYWKSNL